MSKHNGAPHKVVWRVSAEAPQGEYVDSRADETRSSPRRRPAAEPAETSWMQSSIELAEGLEVIDHTGNVSKEWFGHWFGG